MPVTNGQKPTPQQHILVPRARVPFGHFGTEVIIWDIIFALASRVLSGFFSWHGGGLLYVIDINIGAYNATVDLHGTIIQTEFSGH